MISAMTRGWRILDRGKWRRRVKMMMMPVCKSRQYGRAWSGVEHSTCMMKMMMGFLGSYLLGLAPPMMPS